MGVDVNLKRMGSQSQSLRNTASTSLIVVPGLHEAFLKSSSEIILWHLNMLLKEGVYKEN